MANLGILRPDLTQEEKIEWVIDTLESIIESMSIKEEYDESLISEFSDYKELLDFDISLLKTI